MTTAEALQEIVAERFRQEALRDAGKFQHTCASPHLSNDRRLVILAEELGEVARAVCELGEYVGPTSAVEYREMHLNLQAELVQVAAVCVAWLESYKGDR